MNFPFLCIAWDRITLITKDDRDGIFKPYSEWYYLTFMLDYFFVGECGCMWITERKNAPSRSIPGIDRIGKISYI